MAHEITIRENGFAEAVFANDPAWHGLGQVITNPDGISASEAIVAAGLDWEVAGKPVASGEPEMVLTDGGDLAERVVWNRLGGYQAIQRVDTGEVLAVMSDRYRIVQNSEAFACLDALTNERNIRIEAAFSLNGGRSVCVLARTPGEIIINDGDRILPYVLVSTSHDGTGKLLFGPTAVRVVCANTKAAAVSRGTLLGISHKGNVAEKLSKARGMLRECGVAFFSKHAAEITRLVETPLATPAEREAYWTEILGGVLPEDATPRQVRSRERVMAEIKMNYATEILRRGGEHTAWTAYNAFSEVVDHAERRGRDAAAKAETRFKVTQLGAGRKAKDHAWSTAAGIIGAGR